MVAGTSAGASILAEHMIAFGTGGATPKQRMSQLSAGLGLLRGVVIDQHFEQRNRYGRLLSLVAQSPLCWASVSTRTPQPSLTTEAGLKSSAGVRSLWSTGRIWSPTPSWPSARLRYWCLGRCCTCYLLGANSISPPVPCSPIRQPYLIPRCCRRVRQRQSCGMYREKSPLRDSQAPTSGDYDAIGAARRRQSRSRRVDNTLVIANPW